MTELFTIGHSNHPLAWFNGLLRQHGIEQVVDVRSQPFSRRFPEFSRGTLGEGLHEIGVAYVFQGELLGGRPADERWYRPDGSVDYVRRAAAEDFLAAVSRVRELAAERRSALMCAEENPRHCHRRALLAPAFLKLGVTVVHVRGDGSLEYEPGDLFG